MKESKLKKNKYILAPFVDILKMDRQRYKPVCASILLFIQEGNLWGQDLDKMVEQEGDVFHHVLSTLFQSSMFLLLKCHMSKNFLLSVSKCVFFYILFYINLTEFKTIFLVSNQRFCSSGKEWGPGIWNFYMYSQ